MTLDFTRRMVLGGILLPPLAAVSNAMGKISDMKKFDRQALTGLPADLQTFVDSGLVAGIAFQTWQHGELVQSGQFGYRDLASGAPMTEDTLFQIASMTKPVTSAAAMKLVEEGRLSLEDPISKWLPELAKRNVLRNPKGDPTDTVPATREITVEDLLTHKAGYAYSFSAPGPIGKVYKSIEGVWRKGEITTDEYISALEPVPLLFQPGDHLHYGFSTDILGALLERIEGTKLEDIFKARFFEPLGMSDTFFIVPEAKKTRRATTYQFDTDVGALVPLEIVQQPTAVTAFQAGGSGLVSSVGDYARFAQMLLNEGEMGGRRLLKAETIRDMLKNRLTPAQRRVPFMGQPMWEGMTFGLGLGVVDVPEKSRLGYGSRGAYLWPGRYGTWWQADPANGIVMVYMVQHEIPLGPSIDYASLDQRILAGRGALAAYQKATYDALRA